MKTRQLTALLWLLLFIFPTTGIWGQNSFEEPINNSLRFCQEYPMEKVYLHFDNTSYYLGEQIRYKAYIVMAGATTPTVISKVLHVELWNQFGQQIDQQKVEVKNGTACGQFNLSPNNLPGYYEIIAYTHWMLNFGEDNYFSRVFPCYAAPALAGEYQKELFKYQLDITMKTRPKTSLSKIEVNLYPEGGQLVEGIPSTVAFQIKPQKDICPQITKIKIYSPAHQLMDTCRVIHNGMGRFRYCPSATPGYMSFFYKGKEHKYDLPPAVEKGFCLSVSQLSEDSITVCLAKNTNRADTLALCLASGGVIYEAVEVVSDEAMVPLKFLLQKLPCGVAQALLLTRQGKPICQRMFFVNHRDKYVHIHCRKKKSIYAPKEKAKLDFTITDAQGKGIPTEFSLAVRSTVTSDLAKDADNVRSNLLLSSELKGYIHQPEYYFLPSGKVREKELDLLLLVQGWSKYNWDERLHYANSVTPQYMPEQALYLEGYVQNRLKKVQPGITVDMLVQDSLATVMTAQTDAHGFFRFPLDKFNGRCAAILQASTSKGKIKKSRFVLERNFTPPLRAYEPEEMWPLWDNLPEADSLSLEEEEKKEMEKYQADGIVLDQVLVKKKRRNLPLKEYDRSISACYNIKQITEEYLDKGKKYVSLAHLLISNNSNFRWAPHETINLTYKGGTTTYWDVDGQLLEDPLLTNFLLMSNPIGLESITISEGSAAYKYINAANVKSKELANKDKSTSTQVISFMHVTNAALISIKTPHGLDFFLRYPPSPEVRVTYIEGYTKPDRTYAPDYANEALPMEKDHRRTLYWNPSIRTNEKGKAHIEFNNSNKYTTLYISAETLTPEGSPGSLSTY